MSHIIRCDGPGCPTTGPDQTVPPGWTTLVHRGDPVRHFCSAACLQNHVTPPLVGMRAPVDALTGILANAVMARGGCCLLCGEYPALYCGADCASRGR